MKDINIDQINEVTNTDKSIVLIWAEGCEACKIAKDIYEVLPNTYKQFEYYKMQFSLDVLPLYKKLVNDDSLTFPTFLIFDKRNIEENNEYGFVGNVSGLDVQYLEVALQSVGA